MFNDRFSFFYFLYTSAKEVMFSWRSVCACLRDCVQNNSKRYKRTLMIFGVVAWYGVAQEQLTEHQLFSSAEANYVSIVNASFRMSIGSRP